jgi:hypothetical protein
MAAIPIPKLEFPYGTVERALAAAYSIPESARKTTFRSWLGSLQKLGVLGEDARVGRGSPLQYRPDHLHRLIFAMEMSELGASRAIIIGMIRDYWTRKIEPAFAKAEVSIMRNDPGLADVVLYLIGSRFRSGSLSGADPVPNINCTTMAELPNVLALGLKDAGPDSPAAPRVLAVNLSARLRMFHDALAANWLDEAPDAEQAPRQHKK